MKTNLFLITLLFVLLSILNIAICQEKGKDKPKKKKKAKKSDKLMEKWPPNPRQYSPKSCLSRIIM